MDPLTLCLAVIAAFTISFMIGFYAYHRFADEMLVSDEVLVGGIALVSMVARHFGVL